MSDLNTVSSATRSGRQTKTASSLEDVPTTTALAKTTGLADDIVSSFADDSIIASDGGNFTDTDDGYYEESGETSAAPDAVGNTIFFLAIVAFLAIGLGLGIWLWRKNQRTKAAAANGDEKATSTGTGLFHRKQKKGRPSPLPLTNIRTGQEQSLPPYTAGSAFDFATSPFAAGTGQTPLLDRKPSMRQQQSMQTADEWDAASSVDTNPPKTPFTPFTPFSPASANHDALQARSYVPAVRSSLYHSDTMPQPSPVQYMDPEAAQAMGIHSDVINEAKAGVSEEEIERRRAMAQRRLERQQRAEEGSVVEEECTESPGFRQLARAGEI